MPSPAWVLARGVEFTERFRQVVPPPPFAAMWHAAMNAADGAADR
jgi:hypothetical protein